MGLLDWMGYDDEDEEFIIDLQMNAKSRREAIELTGDDSFYIGDDDDDDSDDSDDDSDW